MPAVRPELILQRFLPYRLAQLSQRISTALSAIYREEFDISVAEWRILANLAEKRALNPKEIAQQSSMDKAKVSRAIKTLSARGYVKKRRDEGDNRAYWLSLSSAGEAVYKRIVPLALAWEDRLLESLDAAEYRDMMQAIDKLGVRLDRGDMGSAEEQA